MKREELEKRNKTYALEKLIYYIIFNKDYSEYDDYNKFLIEESFLISLKNIVSYNVLKGNFSEDIKQNMYVLLNYIRFNCSKLSNESVLLVNDIIKLLNNQTEDNSNLFYIVQSYIRTNEKKYILNPIKYQIPKQEIDESICNDYLVVLSHSDEIIEDDFFQRVYLPVLIDDISYYYSLNVILEENPLLFLNKTFYNRMLKILEINSKIVRDFDVLETNKLFIKQINSKVKRYKK